MEVICRDCGYIMTPFDKECPRCFSMNGRDRKTARAVPEPSRIPHAQVSAGIQCPDCGYSMSDTDIICPKCLPVRDSFQWDSVNKRTRKLVSAVIASTLVVAIVLLGISGYVQAKAAEAAEQIAEVAAQQAAIKQQEQERLVQARQYAVVGVLRTSHPNQFITVFPGYDVNIPINMDYATCKVSSLTISQGTSNLSVTVNITGTQPQPQAPTIIVTVYDSDGHELRHAYIVQYTDPDLKEGDSVPVSDTIDTSATPSFIGIDDGTGTAITSAFSMQTKSGGGSAPDTKALTGN